MNEQIYVPYIGNPKVYNKIGMYKENVDGDIATHEFVIIIWKGHPLQKKEFFHK